MSLSQKQKKEIASKLFEAWKTQKPMERITKTYGDFSYDEAYEIQKEFTELQINDGLHPAGKKIGLTSKAMREMVNIDEPDYGLIFHEFVFGSDCEIDSSQFIIPRVESELLFKLKKDVLGDNITRQDIMDATHYVVAAFEIIDNRYDIQDQKITDSIADNAAFGACVIGDIPGDVNKLDLRGLGFVLEKNGKQVSTGNGAAVMEDPINAMVWLAKKMTELGNPLKAGDIVLSGSMIAAVDAAPGDHFRGRFGSLGEVNIFFK